MSTETKTRTITLTNAQPARIGDAAWPLIAVGSSSWHDGEIESQANRTRETWLRVREHTDGRRIVYGSWDYSSAWRGERDCRGKAGEVIDSGADVVAAIRRVAETLRGIAGDTDSGEMIGEAERECIANLPAVTLD